MKHLFKAVFIISIFSVLTRVVGFLFKIYLSRVVGAEILGVYQIAFSVFGVLETFVASGLPLVVSKLTSTYQAQGNTKAKYSCTCAALIVGLITSIGLCLIIFVFRDIFGRLFTDIRCLNILLTLLPAIVFSSVYAVLRGYLWGHKKYFWVSATEFFEQIARVIICVILLACVYSSFDGAIAASLSMTISCILSCIFVIIVFVTNKGKLARPKYQFKPVIKSALPITGVRIASSLLMPIIAIVIPAMLVSVGYTKQQALAEYGIAMGMTFPLLYLPSTIIGSLAMALIPDLSSDMAAGNISSVIGKIKSSLKFTIFISCMVIPVYLGLGEQIGLFLFNNLKSGYYLSYACWIMIPIGVNNIASSILNSLGLEVKGFVNYLIGSIFLIVSLVVLPRYIGILALVWGMGACMTVAALLNIRMIHKKLNKNTHIIKPILLMAGLSIPCAMLCNFVYGVIQHIFPTIISIGICCCIGVISFVTLCIVFNLIELDSWFAKIIKVKQSKKV